MQRALIQLILPYTKHCQHLSHCYSGAQDGRRGPASPQAHLSLLLLRTLFPVVHGIVEEAAQVEGFPTEGDADVFVGDHVSAPVFTRDKAWQLVNLTVRSTPRVNGQVFGPAGRTSESRSLESFFEQIAELHLHCMPFQEIIAFRPPFPPSSPRPRGS